MRKEKAADKRHIKPTLLRHHQMSDSTIGPSQWDPDTPIYSLEKSGQRRLTLTIFLSKLMRKTGILHKTVSIQQIKENKIVIS